MILFYERYTTNTRDLANGCMRVCVCACNVFAFRCVCVESKAIVLLGTINWTLNATQCVYVCVCVCGAYYRIYVWLYLYRSFTYNVYNTSISKSVANAKIWLLHYERKGDRKKDDIYFPNIASFSRELVKIYNVCPTKHAVSLYLFNVSMLWHLL